MQLIETPPKVDQKEILTKKAATIEVTRMDMAVYIKHPIKVKGTLSALQEEMVVMEVEMSIAMLVIWFYPNPPNGGCNGHHGDPSDGDSGPPDDPYGTGLECSSSSESEKKA